MKLETFPKSTQRFIDIPVLYGGEYGPDLEHVAAHNQLSPRKLFIFTHLPNISFI